MMEGTAQGLAIAFIVSLAAGLIAIAIGRRMDAAHETPPPADGSWPIVHPNSTLLVIAAYLAVAIYVFVPLMVTVLLAELAFSLPPAFVIAPLFAFAATLPVGLLLALTLRCVACRKRLLVQEMSSPPFPTGHHGLEAHTAIYARIRTERRCRCMYCGQEHLVSNRRT
jgi:hypothetical protein